MGVRVDVNGEVKFFENTKKCFFFGGGFGSRGGVGFGGGGGLVRVDVWGEVFVKIKKSGGSGWGVRVDVNEELEFLCKFEKKIGGRGEVRGVGLGWVGGGGQGRCERRSEVFVKIQNKWWRSGWGGSGRGGG